MDFSNCDHTKLVWEQIEQNWGDRKKKEGERFLGNNKLARKSVEDIINALSEDLANIGSLSIENLNAKWGDRQARNWVKIITFLLSEYAYYNESENGFWQSVCQRLKVKDIQGARKAFCAVLREGFNLLGLAKAHGGAKYLATLYLQNGIPQQNLKHFAELVEDIAENLGWWNIAYRYESGDLAQTLYDWTEQKHRERMSLRRVLKNSCQDDGSNPAYVEPLSGNILKYIAMVALEIERRSLNLKTLTDVQKREKFLQSLNLPYSFFLRDWLNLVSVLMPRAVAQRKANKVIREIKKELRLRLDTLELNLQLVLPAQNLWRKEWKNLHGTIAQIPQAKQEYIIPYPYSLELPETSVGLNILSDRWTWQLKDANQQDLLEWTCEGVQDEFPLLIFDANTGDRLILNFDDLQIIGVNEIVCYFPKVANLEFEKDIAVIDDCFPCLIADWQAKQIRLTGQSATFSLIGDRLNLEVQYQSANVDQPILRGLQLKAKQPTYLEVPQIYYPLNNSFQSIHMQIEDMDRQLTVTPPDTEIMLRTNEKDWQQINLSQWIKSIGNYKVNLWQGSWNWSTSFVTKQNYQALANPYFAQVQIQNAQQQNVFSSLPIQCSTNNHFWTEAITIEGLWSFEPIVFVLSSNGESHTFQHSMQADQTGCLNLSLMSLREALPDSDRYALDWIRFGNSQRLIETQAQ